MASRAQRVRRPGAPIGRWLSPGIMINPNEPLQKQHRRPKAVIGPRNRVGSDFMGLCLSCSISLARTAMLRRDGTVRTARCAILSAMSPAAASYRAIHRSDRHRGLSRGSPREQMAPSAIRPTSRHPEMSVRPITGKQTYRRMARGGTVFLLSKLQSLKFISFALHGTRNEPKAPSHQSPRAIS